MDTEDKTNSLPLGSALRKARESKNWNIKDVAKRLGISEAYVEYMENEEFDRLFAKIYARNFIKRYAAVLGLNVESMLKTFDEIYKEKIVKREEEEELSREEQEKISIKAKVSYVIVILLLGLIVMEAIQIYRFLSGPEMHFVINVQPQIDFIPMEVFNKNAKPLKIAFNNAKHVIEANSHFDTNLRVGNDYTIHLGRKDNVLVKIAGKTIDVKSKMIRLQVRQSNGGS